MVIDKKSINIQGIAYPAIFYKDEDGYTASFVDFDGASTCDDTLVQCMEAAVDLLAGLAHSKWMDDEELPESTPIHKVDVTMFDDPDEKHLEAFVSMVYVNVAEYSKLKEFGEPILREFHIPSMLYKKALKKKVNFQSEFNNRLGFEVEKKTWAYSYNRNSERYYDVELKIDPSMYKLAADRNVDFDEVLMNALMDAVHKS